jgi:sterol desaturase/sphingolipid hydroxylase (fatty acid hydroxylase superfamily)
LLHRTMHYYQLFWRCHCVHHSDVNIDISTNFRHHPFELILTWSLISSFVWLIDIDFNVLAIFGGISAIIQIWHHSNIKINASIDNYLAYILVTPKIHRIHHSSLKTYTNSNYGMIFTLWDRIFGTFTKPSKVKHSITYGLEYFREPAQQSFIGVLKQPLLYRQIKKQSKSPKI